ncbi:CYP65 [Symbiodinium microadriaticum]|nr:CYP65 [Symbiodinium microadriaticum]
MGKNQHSKDMLHLRPTEWAQDGRGFKATRWTPFSKLPLNCCSLSLQPFDKPVATRDGSVFEITYILKYIKRFGKHPVHGGKLEVKELIPLHFHKNAQGNLHCPVTFKVLGNNTPVCANVKSGHVYCLEAVLELNKKNKNWKDLMTGQPFAWTDIIMLQDPDKIEGREVSKFYFIVMGQQDEVVREITNPESKASLQTDDKIRPNAAVARIFEEKERLAEKKAQEEAAKEAADPEAAAAAKAAAAEAKAKAQELEEAKETPGRVPDDARKRVYFFDQRDSPAVHYVLQGYYDIRNPGGEDPRLPWLCRTIDWRGKQVLDLGCNAGQITRAVAAEGAKLALGVDIDASLIGEARRATSKTRAAGRVRFRCRDLLRLKLRRKYDVVLLLSTSKWVHLQHGDEGLKQLFRRCKRWLCPGGVLVLEPQPWKAYKKVADAHADVEKIWGEIQLKPGSFVDFLTQVLGFDRAYRWAFVDHMQESFQRMLYFFWKPGRCARGRACRRGRRLSRSRPSRRLATCAGSGVTRSQRLVTKGYTSNEAAASFTSTAAPLKSKNELRKLTEEEELQDIYDQVRKKKQKGYVRMVTSHGCLNLELHCDIAPRTSDNFLRLCEKSYYDNTIFHRLIRNFMLQGGDPTGTGRGGESAFEGGKGFKDEFDSRLVHQGPGVLSMANNGKNTNRSQFFVSLKSCEHLNNKHSVFGRVVGGLKLLEVFNNWETDPKDKPVKEIQLVRMEVFKNPFKETVEAMNKPKVEKVVDPVATWFSNRKDPMQGHKNRHSTEVGKYLEEELLPGEKRKKEMPSEELEYANIAQKSKKARTDFDFSLCFQPLCPYFRKVGTMGSTTSAESRGQYSKMNRQTTSTSSVVWQPLDAKKSMAQLEGSMSLHALLLWVGMPVCLAVQNLIPPLRPTCVSGFSNWSFLLLLLVEAHHIYQERKAWTAVRDLITPPELSVMRQLGILRMRLRHVILGILEDVDLYMDFAFPFVALACDRDDPSNPMTEHWAEAWRQVPILGHFLAKIVLRVRLSASQDRYQACGKFRACVSIMFAKLSLLLALRAASAQDESVFVYFGSGCFWHVQHAFIEAEANILGRNASTYTSLTGYAGGNSVNADGKACYNDYAQLGHTEVVGLSIPLSTLPDFGAVFWSLFVGKDRVDVMDIGADYRAAIGVPGGISSSLLQTVNASQASRAQRDGWWFELRAGNGDDPDTLGKALVWVYDTALYPFYQAEVYHQFHDDFLPGGNYPQEYNDLVHDLRDDGRLTSTGCPRDQASAVSAAHPVVLSIVLLFAVYRHTQ